ncbi:tetratricopeptide repeat protein [Streptomyces sp. NPDC093970]|uniref:tetratricopeptide repeat protein n=1 Tax=Streptomyces sp. NPDC093970 TaxID=3155076 RepID=UPI0034324430
MRILPDKRLFKTVLSSVTGAVAIFLSVIAQDTDGTRLVELATSAGVLGGISAISGYFVVHPRTTQSPDEGSEPGTLYVPPPNLPDPSRYFTGREQELSDIAEALRPGRRNAGVRIAVVHGPAGAGKSQLAATYAEGRLRHQRSLVWWLSASSYERLRSDLLELAACLGIPEHDSQNVMLNRLWGKLRDSPGWLLVYDDVQRGSIGPLDEESEDARQSLLPRAGQGDVVITTQQREGWERHRAVAALIELSDLGTSDGLAFLRARVDGESSDGQLEKLGTQLHWWPLALEQAGAYIAGTEISVPEYLRRLPDLSGSRGVVAVTFRLAFERVTAADPVAEDLMRLCSFLASEDVRKDMLLRNPAVVPSPLREVMEDPAAFNRTVRRLSDYSLLRRTGDSRLGTVTYAMHPQVQFQVRQGMDEESRMLWSQAAVQLLEAAFPQRPWQLDQRTVCEGLMPHVVAVTAELAWAADAGDHEFGAARDPQALARLLHRVGEYQEHRCEWKRALDYFEKEAVLRGLHADDDLGRTTALLSVATQRYRLAQLATAEEECREALLACGSHADVPAFLPLQAKGRQLLGGILRERAKFTEALRAMEQAISLYERPEARWDDLDRAQAEQEAGMIQRNAGRLEKALERYARAGELVPSRSSEEPRDHLVFLAMLRRDCAVVAQDRGDLETAERELRAALAVFDANRGTDDFETSQVCKFLADVLRRRGEETRARARETHHPARRLRMGREARRRLDEADALLGPVVELHFKRRESEEHKYAACLNKLGSLRLAQGRHQEALDALLEAEAIYSNSYDPGHPYRAKTLSRLGAVLIATGGTVTLSTGEDTDAEGTLRLAEQIFLTRLGDRHPSLVAVYERLAECAADAGARARLRGRARRIREAPGDGSPPASQPATTPGGAPT